MAPLNAPFQYSTSMNKILKTVIKFKKIVQNIQRISEQILDTKEYAAHIMFFKLNLLKKLQKITKKEPSTVSRNNN